MAENGDDHGLIFCFCVQRPAVAEVLDSGPTGFTTRTVVQIAKPATVIYDALTGRVGEWWVGAAPEHGRHRVLAGQFRRLKALLDKP